MARRGRARAPAVRRADSVMSFGVRRFFPPSVPFFGDADGEMPIGATDPRRSYFDGRAYFQQLFGASRRLDRIVASERAQGDASAGTVGSATGSSVMTYWLLHISYYILVMTYSL